jgi:hypothetical protein
MLHGLILEVGSVSLEMAMEACKTTAQPEL